MAMRALGARHLATLWQSKRRSWEWWALLYGHAQPNRFVWLDRYRWRFHLTPVHAERWGDVWEIGLCLGRRTLYVMRHH